MARAQKLEAIPTLTELLSDPAKVSAVPKEAIATLRGDLAKLDTLLLGHLLNGANAHAGIGSGGDRLLTVSEAAAKLGVSKDTLYRNEYPFIVKIGSRRRFSKMGIEKFIRNHIGM